MATTFFCKLLGHKWAINEQLTLNTSDLDHVTYECQRKGCDARESGAKGLIENQLPHRAPWNSI